MPPRRKRGLSPDDLALWGKVAETVTPLERDAASRADLLGGTAPAALPSAGAVPPGSDPGEDADGPRRGSQPVAPFKIGDRAPGASASEQAIGPQHATAPPRVDGHVQAKLARGKLRPEARIDLHGMTLAQAHPALTDFIRGAQAHGRRLVLVITGKGKDRDAGGVMPVRRGVLRHQVPHWLHTPPLASMVVQVSQAHFRHGGDGAYYVYLRRRV